MLQSLSEAGWNRYEPSANIKDEEITALFNMIDKDKSGSLSMRVTLHLDYHIYTGVCYRRLRKLASL